MRTDNIARRVAVEIRKKIRNLFNNEIGILANNIMPGGCGTSNDGNTATWFSKNYRQSARITGVNKTLILIFHAILHSI
jgi:hypothetical protein